MAQILKNVFGQDAAISKLDRSLQKPVHLLVGPPNVGKKKVALGFAQKILCVSGGCGQCGSCLRVENEQHESLLVVRSETQIKLAQSETVIDFLKLKSAKRVIVIDDLSQMTPPAANALLKNLEEPPPDTFFFLITSNLHMVLPTLRSRSEQVRFGALSQEALKKIEPAAEPWMYKASLGQVEALKNLMGDNSLRQTCYDLLKKRLKNQPTREIFAGLKNQDLNQVTRLLRQMVRDFRVQKLSTSLIHQDLIEAIPLETRQLDLIFKNLLKMDDDLKAHVDKNLIMENF